MRILAKWFLLCVVMLGVPACASSEDKLPWETGSYFPAWAEKEKDANVIEFKCDSSNSQKMGDALARRINSLKPGDKLVVGKGRYTLTRLFVTSISGTAEKPIWVVAKDGEKPIITFIDNSQNVLNIGRVGDSPAEYICFRGLEFTGGSELIKIRWTNNIWIDQCELHDGGGVALAANSNTTHHLYITRNHIHDMKSGTAEGMYIGANYGNKSKYTSYTTIAFNHVHNCSGSQGDGIELKQGSYNCWIVENYVHDTNYPCILAYGTYGRGINLIERNIVCRSKDNTMQVQGEAIVRNNLILAADHYAFFSNKHQDGPTKLEVINNTIINSGAAAIFRDWPNSSDMVFANNAVYSEKGVAIEFKGGKPDKVVVTGNVVYGSTEGVEGGFIKGKGLNDFVGLSWDGEKLDATPVSVSALCGKASEKYKVEEDINKVKREGKQDVGAVSVKKD